MSKKLKKINLERIDWTVILLLFVALLLMMISEIVVIRLLSDYQGTSPEIVEAITKLENISRISTVGVFLVILFSIFYIVKATNRRAIAENENEKQRFELEQSLTFIQDLYENAPLGFYSLDGEGTIVEMNQTQLDWLGYTKEEVIGKMNLFDIVPSEDTDVLLLMRKKLLSTGKLDNIEGVFIRKDGSLLPCVTNSRAVFDELGKFQFVRIAVMDFSKKKKIQQGIKIASEEALAANELLLDKQHELEQNLIFIKDLYEKSPFGYHSTDTNGVFLEMNQTELDWIGYSQEEVIGKMNIKDISQPSTHRVPNDVIKELKEKGFVDGVRGVLINKNGNEIPFIGSSRAIFDDQGAYLYNRSVLMDFTKQQKLEDELKKAKEIAEHSSLLKEQFVANMSHEIRTPLNAIIGFSKLLERSNLPSRENEFAHNIHTSSENLLVIINDVLDFSKIEAGVLRIEKILFSPSSLVYSLKSMFEYRANEKRLKFNVTDHGNIPSTVIGDPNRLTQILVNLLGNAFKFTEQGSITLALEVATQKGNLITLAFKVADSGIGIPESKLETIFERFGQASSETTREYGGAGLGLTISRQLVELQDGQIQVKSIEGKGTTFIFKIPYEIAETSTEKLENKIVKNADFDNDNARILVVEDNPMNRRIIELMLEDFAVKPDFAENGQIAVEMLSKRTYDLILMDIQMPEMDGYTATEIIRQKLKLEVPIIATTAHAFAGEKEKCISSGMNDYLSKPIQEAELLSILMRYLPEEQPPTKGEQPKKNTSEKVITTFDRKYVMAITRGKKEVLRELTEMLINQSTIELKEMADGLEKEDFVAVAKVAHSMRSTVLNMGFNQSLGVVLRSLEIELGNENIDKNKLNLLVQELKDMRKEAIVFLEREFI